MTASGGAFYLFGEDEFRKEEAALRLVEAHLDPSTRDFNFDALRGPDVAVERLASVLATPPMMAEWRVVLLREAEALAGSPRAREVLLGAVRSPPPGLALVVLATVPERSKARFYRDLEQHARSTRFGQVSLNDLPGWLVERARTRHRVELDEEAARALGAAYGSDLGALVNEIEKLATFAGERGRITREDVEAAGVRLPKQDRWQWFDRVGERRFADARTALGTLLAQNESGVGLVAGLGTHLLRLALLGQGGPRALEAALEPHQRWIVKRLGAQARGWQAGALDEALDGLLRADRLLKSSGLSEEALLEEWLLARMAAG